MNRALFVLALGSFLCGMLFVTFEVQRVAATETIYIRADGSIEPSNANITTLDKITYTLSGDIFDEICVQRNNIIIDGAGHTIQADGIGISLSNLNQVTIKNMNLINCSIYLYLSSNITIYRNTIENSNGYGIVLDDSKYNIISENNVTGIRLFEQLHIDPGRYTIGNSIFENRIIDKELAIIASCYNSIYRNHFCNAGINCESITKYTVMQFASGNHIWNNNFLNTERSMGIREPRSIYLDNGYPSGGNYWGDYVDVDLYSGPYQNETESDGIWDHPYSIPDKYYSGWNYYDHYPFTNALRDQELPKADAGSNQSILQGTSVTFDGSESTDDLAIKNYIWSFTDAELKTLTGIKPKYVFNNVGNFEVTLNVTDHAGKWDTDTMWVHVLPDAVKPIANAGPDQTVGEETPITFDGSASTDNVNIANYVWSFIDITPQTLTGVNPTYTFATPGTYIVTLNVTDAAGSSDTDTVQITVLLQVGVKTGDSIKYSILYEVSIGLPPAPVPTSLIMECSAVEGRNATLHVATRMSDGSWQNQTITMDIIDGDTSLGTLSGLVIRANRTIGDHVYLSGFGDIEIDGQTTRTYAGMIRTVVYATFSHNGDEFTYYWDKQTGVLLEAPVASGHMAGVIKAVWTTMWQPDQFMFEELVPYILILIVIAAGLTAALFVRSKKTCRRREKKCLPETSPLVIS